jgi:hypothetical protein
MHLPVVGSLRRRNSRLHNVGGRTDSLTVGDLVLLGQVGGVMDLSGLGLGSRDGDLPFGGLLGYDFISRFPILVDYSAGTLTVYAPESYAQPDGGSPVPFEFTMQVPTVQAELDGLPGRFLVDLGNPMGVIVHRDFSRKNNLLATLKNVTDLSVGIGVVAGWRQMAEAESFVLARRIERRSVVLPDSGSALTGSVSWRKCYNRS